MSDFRKMSIKKAGVSIRNPGPIGGGDSADALEQLDEQVYETHEQVEDDPKNLHDDVSDVVEGAHPAKHQGQHQHHRYDQQQPARLGSPPTL